MRLLLSFLSFLIVAPALAASPLPVYKIDPGHTRVSYTISHLGFTNMPGHFNGVSGTIAFAPDRVNESAVDIAIKTSSLSMDHDVLDKKLAGEEFFNTAKFPQITFKSTKVEKLDLRHGRMTGDLTFLGVTKPVTLRVAFNKKAFNKYDGAEEVGFSATAKIKRSDFGMKAYLPDIGDEVKFYIEVEALQQKPEDVSPATSR